MRPRPPRPIHSGERPPRPHPEHSGIRPRPSGGHKLHPQPRPSGMRPRPSYARPRPSGPKPPPPKDSTTIEPDNDIAQNQTGEIYHGEKEGNELTMEIIIFSSVGAGILLIGVVIAIALVNFLILKNNKTKFQTHTELVDDEADTTRILGINDGSVHA
ncbi:predicted protein [Naegleria gruberi]|uniref:Predicted protein n=1 Tax=Naegleria gruberi TaxID=5762 RepID=D2VE29_NAEGR|nr:uncharacterized protein NAEGRDRAFT_67129 [Naegleria gruberi]EFC45007.1 predicted protein [Naegleria gruberi]|eukprot:XP_002677751.1 predicted protein [Naegleria gruberi strain NEG-M]